MDAVRSGLDRSVENGACGTAQFGAEVRGLNLELRDCVDRRKNDEVCSVQEVNGVGVIVNAIQQIVVLRRAQTVGGKGSGGCIASRIGLGTLRACTKLGKEGKVAPIERQRIHALLSHHLSDGCFLGLQLRRSSTHFNGFS